ncbi:MAG: hypothetical protein ACOCXV_02640 [Bacteroidota bacterium]
MRIRNLTVSNARLTEGSYHTFTILKTVSFGADDSFFVMQDPNGYKVLMPACFYEKYGFAAGQKIFCRVDRINCNGRMFLEPMHPHYKEGETYTFEQLETGTQQSITGEMEYFVKVRDVLGYKWRVRVFSEKYINPEAKFLQCRLERIKKGKLFLSLHNDKPVMGGLHTGNIYPFTILEDKVNPRDNLAYWILEDHNGRKHLLRKKYYLHYSLKPGKEIRCRVEKFTSEGYFFLEPENPWYKEGQEYEFNISEIQRLHFSDGKMEDVLVLADPHGEDIKVFIPPAMVNELQGKQKVRCRIKRIRKSRIEPEITAILSP